MIFLRYYLFADGMILLSLCSVETDSPTGSPMERVPTPEPTDVSPTASVDVQPAAIANAPETAKDVTVTTLEVGASASNPASGMDHVSILCSTCMFCDWSRTHYAYVMCLQPFSHALAKSGKSFVKMEQERDSLCLTMEQLSHKFFCLCTREFLFLC